MALLSTSNILKQKFRLLPFKGAWRDSFGTPADTGVWTIEGESGSGKTTFTFQIVKLLRSMNKRVIYWSIEECGTYGFQQAVRRANLNRSGCGVKFAAATDDFDHEIAPLLEMKRGYNVLIIDSLTALDNIWPGGFRKQCFAAWQKRFADKLLIYICHYKKGTQEVKTSAGEYIHEQANIKVSVVGFKAFVQARAGFQDGCGGAEYVINQAKAEEYSLENL